MEGYWFVIVTVSLLGIVLLGAFLQTAKLLPTVLDSVFDKTASRVTFTVTLLGLSFLLVPALLQLINRMNREGFETPKAMDSWKKLVETYQVSDVCALKGRIEEKLLPAEKGSPPNELTDEQARERVNKIFSDKTSNGSVDCALFQKVNDAKDIDTFFTTVQELPDTFLIQVQETAERIDALLQKQYDAVMTSLEKKEGFIDPSVGICSPEVTEERRKFLRQKKLDEQAQRCLLPEEVPLESKETIAENKVKKIQDTYDAYIRMSPRKPLIIELMTKSLDNEKKLEDKKKAAESGVILSQE